MNRRDLHFLDLAIDAARTSDHYKTRVGAVLVYHRSIISVGVNSNIKSHPLQKYYNTHFRGFDSDICKHLVHAELDCLIKYKAIRVNLSGLVMYIGRVFKDGEVVSSRPCRGCLAALKRFEVRTIYYMTEDGVAEEWLTKD